MRKKPCYIYSEPAQVLSFSEGKTAQAVARFESNLAAIRTNLMVLRRRMDLAGHVGPEETIFAEADDLREKIRSAHDDLDQIASPMQGHLDVVEVHRLRHVLLRLAGDAESLALELEASMLASKTRHR